MNSTGSDNCVGRIIQGDGLAIRENHRGLLGLASHRQAPIFYRNWPWKGVLSGQGKARGGLDGNPERIEKQGERGESLKRVAFPESHAGFGVVGSEEGVLFF